MHNIHILNFLNYFRQHVQKLLETVYIKQNAVLHN